MDSSELGKEHDANLIAAARRGEILAFTNLVERYQQRVYRFALKHVGTREHAREITRRTFLVAYARIHSLHDPANVAHWLFAIALPLTRAQFFARAANGLDFSGSDRARDRSAFATADAATSPCTDLQRAIDHLPREIREPLVLVRLEEVGCETAAELLQLAPRALKVRIAIAVSTLREVLNARAGHPALWLDGAA